MTTCLKAKDEHIQIGLTGIILIPSRNEAARCHRYKGPRK